MGSRTFDRHPGSADYESESVYTDEGLGDPVEIGGVRLSNGQFRMYDQLGVFNPRSAWASFIDGPTRNLAGSVYKVVTGVPFVSKVAWYKDAAKTLLLADRTYSFGSNPALPTQVVTRLYKTDGTTVLSTCTDQYSYTGAFVAGVTRSFT